MHSSGRCIRRFDLAITTTLQAASHHVAQRAGADQASDHNHGEDYEFVRQLVQAGFRLHAAPDTTGLVLHLVHANSSSLIFPQYRLPPFLLPAIFGEVISSYTSANIGDRG